jgi:chemotaxis protein methyltransferase CheR
MRSIAAGAPSVSLADERLPSIRSVVTTAFFRYEHHHRALAEIALPAVARAAATHSRTIRILSAGCATGEEPYSIAMTVRDRWSSLCGMPVEILAIDASEDALATAAKGLYSRAQLAGVPPAYVTRYFVERKDGFAVVPALRGMVKFLRHDLRDGLYLGKFDVVFCANVLLYFAGDAKREIVQRLETLIRKDGYVFLGHADAADLSRELFQTTALPSFVYRRR